MKRRNAVLGLAAGLLMALESRTPWASVAGAVAAPDRADGIAGEAVRVAQRRDACSFIGEIQQQLHHAAAGDPAALGREVVTVCPFCRDRIAVTATSVATLV